MAEIPPITECMFDTNVFNRIVDEEISLKSLIDSVTVYVTHIQRDEINNTKNPKRRAVLVKVFSDVVAVSKPTDNFVLGVSRLDQARLGGEREVPTASAVYGVSKWGKAKWSAEDNIYTALKTELDKLNKNKPNNIQDALIAETSIKGKYILVTEDADLAEVTKKYGGKCLSVPELLNQFAR
jgi:predicted nucleic acid-binding protein